jgi:hypothetical protein
MTIEQTIEIPASRRITLEVPQEIPTGPGILTFTPAPRSAADQGSIDPRAAPIDEEDEADWAAYLKANTPHTIEEAIAEAKRKLADPNRKPFSRHFGALQGAFGDGMEYQRKMRDEWPD